MKTLILWGAQLLLRVQMLVSGNFDYSKTLQKKYLLHLYYFRFLIKGLIYGLMDFLRCLCNLTKLEALVQEN